MGKVFYILICFLIFTLTIKAQVNTVLNPSFEIHDTCPVNFLDIRYCKYWSALDTGSYGGNYSSCIPEYCNVCNQTLTSGISLPMNWGQGPYYKYPRTGDGLINMLTYFQLGGSYTRDYIRGRLKKVLVQNKTYCGKFYVILRAANKFAINRFGAYCDNGKIDTNNSCHPMPQIIPYFENNTSIMLNDTLNWMKIEGIFNAKGNESFITIGNFSNDINTLTQTININSTWPEAYYYLDDVSIIATDITAYAGADATICVSDSIHLGRMQEVGLECLWYKPTIATPFASTSDIWFKSTQTGTYTFIQRMDNCAITWDTVNITVIQDCSLLLPSTQIPNVFTPNGDGINDVFSFTFSGILTNFSLYNRWGNIIHQSTIPNQQSTILWDGRTTSGEACSEGVYFYTLEYKDSTGAVIKKNGYVSLLR